MTLTNKYTHSIAAFGILFIAASFLIFMKQMNVNFEAEAVNNSQKHLDIISANIEEIFQHELETAEYFASQPDLIDLVNESNSKYKAYMDSERDEVLAMQNDVWMGSESSDDFVSSILENQLSNNINSISSFFNFRYGELFITNKYGAVAGSTSKLTTFTHNYKNWWKKAYNFGKGKVFIDDRGFDESAGDYVLGFVTPIYENNEITGILKCNVSMKSLLAKMVKYEDAMGDNWSLIISRKKGAVVFKNGVAPLSETLSDNLLHKLEDENNRFGWVTEEEESLLFVNRAISATFNNDIYDFGGTLASIDHNSGNSGENWELTALISKDDLYEKSAVTLRSYILVAVFFVICSIIAAFFISIQLTKHIKSILPVIEQIGRGNLESRIESVSDDEIGLISTSINKMADNLQNMLATKKTLQDRVSIKDELFKELNHRVKNNLMLISSLIELKEISSSTELDLGDIKHQIDAIRLTHEMLIESKEMYKVDIASFLLKILKNVFSLSGDRIKIKSNISIKEFDIDTAKLLGLIINETATNTIKYSGYQNKKIEYCVDLHENEDKYIFKISNDGESISANVNLNNPKTLGLQLIAALVSQLRGSVTIVKEPSPSIVIEFPS